MASPSLTSGAVATLLANPYGIAVTCVVAIVVAAIVVHCASRGDDDGWKQHDKLGKIVATVAELYVYPVKSCAGCRVEEADVSETGLRFDRRFMVVSRRYADAGENSDSRLAMVSQREYPRMALVHPELVMEGDQLVALRLTLADCLDGSHVALEPLVVDVRRLTQPGGAVSYTHLTLPTNREV